MTSNVVIAVGIVTDSWSELAKNAPECVKVWTIDELEQTVLVGTTFKEFTSGSAFNMVELDQNKAFEAFKEYALAVRQLSRSDFGNDHDFEHWNAMFANAEIETFIFAI